MAFISIRNSRYMVMEGSIEGGAYNPLTEIDEYSLRIASVGYVGSSRTDFPEIWVTGTKMEVFDRRGRLQSFNYGSIVNVSWDHTGTRQVYHTSDPGDPIFTADDYFQNVSADPIAPGKAGVHQHYPVWSADGSWIYFIKGSFTNGLTDLWRMRPDGSESQPLTRNLRFLGWPTPIGSDTVMFVANEPDGSGPWLWYMRPDSPDKQPRRASYSPDQYRSISASRDGLNLVATTTRRSPGLWSFSYPEAGTTVGEKDTREFEGMEEAHAYGPRFSRKGGDFYFIGARGSADSIWCLVEGATTPKRLRAASNNLFTAVSPAISPNGTKIAVVHFDGDTGRRLLTLWNHDGSPVIDFQVPASLDVSGSPCWSPDGQWIAVGGRVFDKEKENDGMFKVAVTGGKPIQLHDRESLNPLWSPYDDLILIAGEQHKGHHRVQAVLPDGSGEIELPTPVWVQRNLDGMRFHPTENILVVMEGPHPAKDFYAYDMSGLDEGHMERRRLTHLEPAGTMRSFDFTPDGRRIVFDRILNNSDVVHIALDPE